MLSEAQADWIGLFIAHNYQFNIQNLSEVVDEMTIKKEYSMTLIKKLTNGENDDSSSEVTENESRSRENSGTKYTDSMEGCQAVMIQKEENDKRHKKGFKPNLFFNIKLDEEIYDLKVDQGLN